MNTARKMLLETLKGHLSLLEKVHPKIAALPAAQKIKELLRGTVEIRVAG